MRVGIKKLHPHAIVPTFGSLYAAGADLHTIETVTIPPGQRALLRTGLAMVIENGYVGLIWPRSKLAAKQGLDRLAGVVDSDYRGEVMISLVNHGHDEVALRKGDKVAQMLFQEIEQPLFWEVDKLDITDRGSAGVNDTDMRLR